MYMLENKSVFETQSNFKPKSENLFMHRVIVKVQDHID